MDILACVLVENDYFENLENTFIIASRKNQFIQETILKNAPKRQIAIAMNTNSAFLGSYNENPFWWQQFDLRQITILWGRQPFVNFNAADNCRLFLTIMKAMNFQDGIPSIPIDNFKDHYVLVSD